MWWWVVIGQFDNIAISAKAGAWAKLGKCRSMGPKTVIRPCISKFSKVEGGQVHNRPR